jgi:DNA-binding NarL/FixJ family response regulator
MKTTTKLTRVVLADDHQILLEGLREILQGTFDIVGTAVNGRELVALTLDKKPEVVITDIVMPDMTGIDAIQQVHRAGFRTAVVFLTMLKDAKLAMQAFETGGPNAGYVLKNSAGSELVTAIQEVLAGRSYITPRIANDLLNQCAQHMTKLPDGLTARQSEVLQLIAHGKTMKEIAAVLEISTRTAEAHKYQMMEHLGFKTTAQLIRFALQQGLGPMLSPNLPPSPGASADFAQRPRL